MARPMYCTDYGTTEYVRKTLTIYRPDKFVSGEYDNGKYSAPVVYELEIYLVEHSAGMQWFGVDDLMQAVNYWLDRGIDDSNLRAVYRYYDPVQQVEPEIIMTWNQHKQEWETR